MSFRLLVRDYLIAVGKHWYSIVAGVGLGWVDLLERSFGTWRIFPLWVRLTTGAVGLTIAQFLAYRDLHQEHLQRVADLQKEIEALKVKPYDRAQAELRREGARTGRESHRASTVLIAARPDGTR